MFTGIITNNGKIKSIKKTGDWIITIAVENFTNDLSIGASIACNGVCLTAIDKTENSFSVQVSDETLAKTSLEKWQEGQIINLERALKVGDELGGHFVSGHVDGLAELVKKEKINDSWKLEFAAPKELAKYIAKKGSVTLDGVSLTVNEVLKDNFWVNIISHT
ncbi:MAG: riboflavin synthase, partial [Pseudomonadota bacterium]